MSGYAERIAELSHRVTSIDLRLKSIDAERAANVIEASQGAQSALRKIAELDAETDQLRRSKAILTSAADQLDGQMREEEATLAATSRAEREQRAREIGAAICTLHLEGDALLLQLRQLFERRAGLLAELHRLGRDVQRLAGKEPLSAAAYHAGLRIYLALEPAPISSIRPLADANALLSGVDGNGGNGGA
jgi:hypothetical protein